MPVHESALSPNHHKGRLEGGGTTYLYPLNQNKIIIIMGDNLLVNFGAIKS